MSSAEEKDALAAASSNNLSMNSLELEMSPPGGGSSNDDENVEMDALVSGAPPVPCLTKRSAAASGGGGGSSDGGFFAALLLERNHNFSARSFFLVAGLAGLVLFFVKDVDRAVFSSWRGAGSSSSSGGDGGGGGIGIGSDPLPGSSSSGANANGSTNGNGGGAGGFHGSSFGGVNNLGHPGGAREYSNEYEEIFIPVSNVGHAVPSIGPENVLNFMGHYVHDEHRSPYASHLYKRPLEELDAEQKKYEEKMAAVREQWGAWDLEDEKEDSRPTANFDGIEYRDLPADDFPEGSWQTDKEYVTKFLDQAKGLVTRVKEGIYAEYGQPTIKPDGTKLSDAEIIERDKRFAIAHESDEDHAGKLGGMSRRSWDALVMKLLHAMMTNDEFYCVMGGHSSAAGHGNNFRQAKMMAFHYLMEPIFDKLGMRLISRNNAQGGVGTTHSAMASGSFYGEKDIVWWDSSMTEKGAGAHDIFNKQAILGGERVPILMNCPRVDIMADTNGTAWTGNNAGGQWEAGGMLLPEYVIKDAKHADTVPFALRYMLCTKEAGGLCQQHKYDSICWEPRSDFEPTAEQKAHPGSQVKWHPGVRAHLQASRIMSLVVLHALDSAIDKWTALASAHTDDTPTVPLPAEYWHVGTKYRWIQKGLRTTLSKSPDGQSACEKMLGRFPRACRVAMKGFGDWTPRRNPSESSLLAVMKPAPNGYVPHPSMPTEFAGINVMPLIQRVPDGEVDVHAIALASTKPAPRLDHSMEGGEEERRKLAELSHEAVQSRSRRAHTIHERRKRALREKELAEQRSQKRRRVEGDGTVEIVPGRGWLWGQEAHFCDGSYNSECGRQRGSDCLISGHNDGRGGFVGGGLSGWFVLTLPKVKEGLILMRMEYWMGGPGGNALTKDWTEENGGKTNDAEPKYVFPDVTPSVNVTTPFDKLKEAKKAAEAAAKDAPPAPASPANVTNPVPPPAPAAAPAVTSANSTNATRSLLRRNAARRLAATRITRASIDANADPYAGVEYPFEHLTEEEWSALTDDDFKGEGGRDRRNNNHQNHNRNLKAPPPAIPDDWKFEIAINGKMHKVMDKNEFMSHAVEIVKNWAIWPLMDDVEWSKKDWGNSEGEDVEVAVRMSSVSMPRRSLRISHVYYA